MRSLTRAIVSHANFLQILRKTQKYRSVSIKHIFKHADIHPGQKLHQVQKEYLKSVHYSQRYGALLMRQQQRQRQHLRPPLAIS